MSKIISNQTTHSGKLAFRIFGIICSIFIATYVILGIPTQLRAEERDNAGEAVTNLEAYAAFKMGQHDKARRIWEKLAEKGNVTALLNLANMFQQAQGVEEDQKKALTYVRKGAQFGDPRAQYELGMAYERGTILKRDLQQAAQWFEKAAMQGEVDAQFALGVLNVTAFGKGQNSMTVDQRKQAIAWLSKADAQGHEEARTYLNLIVGKQKPM